MLGNIHNLGIYIPTIFHYTSDSEEDTMGSSTPETRRAGMQRRDSSRSNSGGRRPKLLRSSATEPSLTASMASCNAPASSQSSRRATDLLNQFAFSSSPPSSLSPLSQSPTMYDSPERISMAREEQVSMDFDGFRPHLDSNRYYSFPSFENWEPRQLEEGETEMKSP